MLKVHGRLAIGGEEEGEALVKPAIPAVAQEELAAELLVIHGGLCIQGHDKQGGIHVIHRLLVVGIELVTDGGPFVAVLGGRSPHGVQRLWGLVGENGLDAAKDLGLRDELPRGVPHVELVKVVVAEDEDVLRGRVTLEDVPSLLRDAGRPKEAVVLGHVKGVGPVKVGAVEGDRLREVPHHPVKEGGLALLGLGVEDVGVEDLIPQGVVELEGSGKRS